MPDGNEFLEMRLAQGGRIVPHGLDDALPGFTAATDAARRELLALSRAVLGCVEAYAGMQKGALVHLLNLYAEAFSLIAVYTSY